MSIRKVQRQPAIGKSLLEGGGTFGHQVMIALFLLSFANSLVNRLSFSLQENLRRLFQPQSSVDEFSQWCYQSLRSLNSASTIDSKFLPP